MKIKPSFLRKGDTVGLVTPAYWITSDELSVSRKALEAFGLKVKTPANLMNRHGYLGGKDAQRAAQINEMVADSEVRAIVAARGGYGSARLLDKIDYEAIKQNPKIIAGYSDITALLNTIQNKTGLVCFHSPMGVSTFSEATKKSFEAVLFSVRDNVLVAADESEYFIINEGVAQGELIGGNLSILASLCGTPYELNFKDKMVFIEEVDEEPFRIDRMFTQLLQNGSLQKASGIVLGMFRGCNTLNPQRSFTLKEVLFDRLEGLNLPVAYGFPFGHTPDNSTLPVGASASLNTLKGHLTMLESAVKVR